MRNKQATWGFIMIIRNNNINFDGDSKYKQRAWGIKDVTVAAQKLKLRACVGEKISPEKKK